MPKSEGEFSPPNTLAACADLLYATRERRLKLSKQVDELEAQEGKLKNHLIMELPKVSATGVSGKVARVSLESKEVVKAEHWDEVYAYILKNNAFELLQRRLNEVAIKEHWEAGKPVPGVTKFPVTVVSLGKI